MTTIVERLRDPMSAAGFRHIHKLHAEAADCIEQLQQRVARLSTKVGPMQADLNKLRGLEKDFAKFAESDATSEDLWRSLDDGKRLSKSLRPK